jgi:hypothetical protein
MSKLIQVRKDDSLQDMAEKIIISVVSKLAIKDKTNLNIDRSLEMIRNSYGEESYQTTKNSLMELLNNNILGLKSFIADLVQWIAENDGEKFKINLVRLKEKPE